MPTQLVLDVTPSVLDKAAKAKKRGKATEMQHGQRISNML